MARRRPDLRRAASALGAVLLTLGGVALPTAAAAKEPGGAPNDVRMRTGRAPVRLAFEPGPRSGAGVEFLARGLGYTLRLTATELTLDPAGAGRDVAAAGMLRVRVVGGNPGSRLEAVDPLPGQVHYLLGSDPARWRTHVPTYAKVASREVYPGIDLVYYGSQRQLEFDFVVSPGADPEAITLAFEGGEPLEVDEGGHVRLRTAAGEVRLERPRLYQVVEGQRREVPGEFVLSREGRLTFRVGRYDAARALVIDPVLVYSTYLGGSAPGGQPYQGGVDDGRAIAVDAAGNAYVTGSTNSVDFPATGGSPPAWPGRCFAQDRCPNAFVTKFDPAGHIVFSTFVGGGDSDWGNAIALDSAGSIYLAGATQSPDFPTTAGAFQRTHGPTTCGTHYFSYPCSDAFVAKLTPDGAALVYSTFLGGAGVEEALGLAVDSAGQAHVVGTVATGGAGGPPGSPPDFPTVNALQPTYGGGGDGFVTKLNAAGSALVYSTYLGGSGSDVARAVAVDADGNAYVAGGTASPDFPVAKAFQATPRGGGDAFLVKLGPDGALIFGTYLGGSGWDEAFAIALDAARNIYVAGRSSSTDFPLNNPLSVPAGGLSNAFVTKFTPDGAGLAYSTLFGGSMHEWAYGIAVDGAGSAYVTGLTTSADMPVVNPVQSLLGNSPCAYFDSCSDAFVIKLDSGGLAFATYLGGSGIDVGRGIGIDAAGNVYVVGTTGSPDFPTVNAARATCPSGTCGQDAFVAKISLAGGAPPPLHQLTFRSPPAGAPNPVASGGTVQLAVDAVDTLGHPLTYAWAATCGFTLAPPGTFSDPASPAPTWTAPANTTGWRLSCGISVTVDDGHGRRQTAGYSQWVDPTIGHVMRIVMGPLGTPNPVRSGGTAVPSIVVADSFNHALSYAWSATCPGLPGAGTFSDPHRLSPDWTAPANPTGTAQACRLAVTVSDGEGLSVSGAYEQMVSSDEAPAGAPIGLTTSVNQERFTAGQVLALSLGLEAVGLPGPLDFYVGVILPDGDTVVCLTDGGRGFAVGRVSDPGTFRPIAVGVSMTAPLAVAVPDLMTHAWTGSEPPGTYLFFVVAARPGTFQPADVVAASVRAFTFNP